MTKDEVMAQLMALGDEQTRKTLTRHGMPANGLGVKIGDMRPIQKKIKKNHALSMELYRTGITDAMYLAGLIADEKKISKQELQEWLRTATWYMLCESTVAWVAAESPYGWELGLEWIESDEEMVQVAGWSTLSSVMSILPDEQLDIAKIDALLDRVEATIQQSANRTRYVMNSFVIAAGGFVPIFTDKAITIGERVGKVYVDLGDTACKVPSAPDYLRKMVNMGVIGKKKKMARC